MTSIRQAWLNYLQCKHPNQDFINLFAPHWFDLELQFEASEGRCHHRVPYRNLTYRDIECDYLIEDVGLTAGTTGWNWNAKASIAWGFDFDHIIGHAQGVGRGDEVIAKIDAIRHPWMTIVRSKGGRGRHAWVFAQDLIPAETHKVHSEIAKYWLLPRLSRETGFDLCGNVDAQGVILWIGAVQHAPNAFEFIHRGTGGPTAADVQYNPPSQRPYFRPTEYRDDLLLDTIEKYGCLEQFDFEGGTGWQFHSFALKQAHQELQLPGEFDTLSTGTDLHKPNCYGFFHGRSLRVKSWLSTEHSSWNHDGDKPTITVRLPAESPDKMEIDGLIQLPKGFEATSLDVAAKFAQECGIEFSSPFDGSHTFGHNKDGWYVEVPANPRDERPVGWVKVKDCWRKKIDNPYSEYQQSRLANACANVRKVYTPYKQESSTANVYDAGIYTYRLQDGWIDRATEQNIRTVAAARFGVDPTLLLHTLEMPGNEYYMIDLPFGPEYPRPDQLPFKPPTTSKRLWNRSRIKLRVEPVEGECPTWDMVLARVFSELDPVMTTDYCVEHNFRSGLQYIKAWIGLLIRDPYVRLPFLYIWGERDTGKTTFVEAIEHYCFDGGVAEVSSMFKEKFNSALVSTVIGYVSEEQVKDERKLKALVTDKIVAVREMYSDSRMIRPTIHFMQFANDNDSCGLLTYEDDRAVALHSPPIPPHEKLPGPVINALLEAEAATFLWSCLYEANKLPPYGRLYLPVFTTQSKLDAIESSFTPFQQFVTERCKTKLGGKVSRADFIETFNVFLESRNAPPVHRLGRVETDFLKSNGYTYDKHNQVIKGMQLC